MEIKLEGKGMMFITALLVIVLGSILLTQERKPPSLTVNIPEIKVPAAQIHESVTEKLVTPNLTVQNTPQKVDVTVAAPHVDVHVPKIEIPKAILEVTKPIENNKPTIIADDPEGTLLPPPRNK